MATKLKTYGDAIEFVLAHEGKINEDVPGDPGGKTHWGVTASDYSAYRSEHGLSKADVFKATEKEVYAIYHEHYGNPIHFDELPYSLGLTLFDGAVNCGTGRAVCWLQGVLGVVVDGGFGPVTLATAKAYITKHGAFALCEGVIARRVAYYEQIGGPGKRLNKFLKGWMNRIADLKQEIGLT